MSSLDFSTRVKVHDAILEGIYESMPNPLPVPITKGKMGRWTIDTFKLTAMQVRAENLANYFNGEQIMMVKPGTYTRLIRTGPKGTGTIVMSNTPMEVRTNAPFIKAAKGRVLISGLGLGMALKAVLAKPDVTSVKVIEIDGDLIHLITSGAFTRELLTGRLVIEQADALAYKPAKDERYDVAWHDIWDEIDDDNLAQMAQLTRKWQHRIPLQLCWAKEQCQKMKRQVNQRHLPAWLFT